MNVAALLQDSPSEQRTPRQQLAAQQQQQQQPGHRSSSSSPSVAFPNGSGPVMGSLRPGQDGFGKVDTGPEIEMAERDRAREHDPVRERERLLRKVEDVAGSSSVVDDNRTPFGLGRASGSGKTGGSNSTTAGGAPMPARMPVPLPGSGMKTQRRETPTQPYGHHTHTHLAPHPSHPSLPGSSSRPPSSHPSPGGDLSIPPYGGGGGSRGGDTTPRDGGPNPTSVALNVPPIPLLPPMYNNNAPRESSRGPPTAPRRDRDREREREQPPTAPRRDRERDSLIRERDNRDALVRERDAPALPRDRGDRERERDLYPSGGPSYPSPAPYPPREAQPYVLPLGPPAPAPAREREGYPSYPRDERGLLRERERERDRIVREREREREGYRPGPGPTPRGAILEPDLPHPGPQRPAIVELDAHRRGVDERERERERDRRAAVEVDRERDWERGVHLGYHHLPHAHPGGPGPHSHPHPHHPHPPPPPHPHVHPHSHPHHPHSHPHSHPHQHVQPPTNSNAPPSQRSFQNQFHTGFVHGGGGGGGGGISRPGSSMGGEEGKRFGFERDGGGGSRDRDAGREREKDRRDLDNVAGAKERGDPLPLPSKTLPAPSKRPTVRADLDRERERDLRDRERDRDRELRDRDRELRDRDRDRELRDRDRELREREREREREGRERAVWRSLAVVEDVPMAMYAYGGGLNMYGEYAEHPGLHHPHQQHTGGNQQQIGNSPPGMFGEEVGGVVLKAPYPVKDVDAEKEGEQGGMGRGRGKVVHLGSFVYPALPFPYVFPPPAGSPSLLATAASSSSLPGTSSNLPAPHLPGAPAPNLPAEPSSSSDAETDPDTRLTVYIPPLHLPLTRPERPRIWGGGLPARFAAVLGQGSKPSSPPGHHSNSAHLHSNPHLSSNLHNPNPHTPTATADPKRQRVYTDDSDPFLCALHAGYVTWSGARAARKNGMGLRVEVRVVRCAGSSPGLGSSVSSLGSGTASSVAHSSGADGKGTRTVGVGLFLGGWGERYRGTKGDASSVLGGDTSSSPSEELPYPADEKPGMLGEDDDGRGLVSAGWGSMHDGSAIEVLGAEFVEKDIIASLGLRTRPQRLAEYAERKAAVCGEHNSQWIVKASSSSLKKRKRSKISVPTKAVQSVFVSPMEADSDVDEDDACRMKGRTLTLGFGGVKAVDTGFKYDARVMQRVLFRKSRKRRRADSTTSQSIPSAPMSILLEAEGGTRYFLRPLDSGEYDESKFDLLGPASSEADSVEMDVDADLKTPPTCVLRRELDESQFSFGLDGSVKIGSTQLEGSDEVEMSIRVCRWRSVPSGEVAS